MGYAIAQSHVVRRASVTGGGKSEIAFEVAQSSPVHATRRDAVRSFVTGMDPGLVGASDAFIQIHWSVYVRNKLARCVRAPMPEKEPSP